MGERSRRELVVSPSRVPLCATAVLTRRILISFVFGLVMYTYTLLVGFFFIGFACLMQGLGEEMLVGDGMVWYGFGLGRYGVGYFLFLYDRRLCGSLLFLSL